MEMIQQRNIIERIKYLIKEMRFRQAEFANRIGVDPSNLSKYLNEKLPISDALINRIVVNVGVSKDWLVDGSDLPFAKSGTGVRSVNVDETQIVEPADAKGTKVYGIDVTAGAMPREMMFADDRVVGTINLPELLPTDAKVVRVSGDSMSPVIQNGDFIAVREVTNMQQIFWGQIYVILLDDYRLVKYVRRHPSAPDKVILRSANPAYDDMEVRLMDIRELMFVHHILHVDTRC